MQAAPDFRAFPKDAMSALMFEVVAKGPRSLRDLLDRLPLLPEERVFVRRASDDELRKTFARARAMWNMELRHWDDPDALDAAVKTATALCDGHKATGRCTLEEVLERFNDVFQRQLTMAQLQRRIARVDELRAAPGYAGPSFGQAPLRHAPLRQGRGQPVLSVHADLSPVAHDPLQRLMDLAKDRAIRDLEVVGHGVAKLPPIRRQSGGHDVGQKWLDAQNIADYQFIRRSANALTIKAPVMIGGQELFIKVAALQVGDDPVRDAFNSLIMSAVVDPRTVWTADFIGVRACYNIASGRRAPPKQRVAAAPWWVLNEADAPEDVPMYDADANSADILAMAAADARAAPAPEYVQRERPFVPKRGLFAKMFAKRGGGRDAPETFGFRDNGAEFTHLALFYRNAPGQTVDSMDIDDRVSNHAVIDLLQRIVVVGSVHGMTHNDMHTGNVMRSKGGLRVIDYGRVVYRDLKVVEEDASLMDELSRLQRQVLKIPSAPSQKPRALRAAASDGKWDVFKGVDVPTKYTWISDFISCTLWMQGIVSTGAMKDQFNFEDAVVENKRVLRGMVAPPMKEYEIAAATLKADVDGLLLDRELAFLAPGMALYGMVMFYATHDHFHLGKTMVSGGHVLKKIIDLVERQDPEATLMFEVVKSAMEANGIVAECFYPSEQSGGGMPEPRKPAFQVLDGLSDLFAATMADNAELRDVLEEVAPEPLSPSETLQMEDLPLKVHREAVSVKDVGMPSVEYAGKHADAIGDFGNDINYLNTMKIGTDYVEGGGKPFAGRVLSQVALSCVVLAAAVIGSMS